MSLLQNGTHQCYALTVLNITNHAGITIKAYQTLSHRIVRSEIKADIDTFF